MSYVELQVSSAFSFLRGASHAEELVKTAAALGLSAIGLTDTNSVAGVVRMHVAAQEAKIRFLPGCRLVFRDKTPDMLCYPRNRAAWGGLTRLLTVGKLRAKKSDRNSETAASGYCLLDYEDLIEYAAGQILVIIPPDPMSPDFIKKIPGYQQDFGTYAYIAATRRHRDDDALRLRTIANLGLPMVATNDVLYHAPERYALQNAMTALRLGCRIDEIGSALEPNAERCLKPAKEMRRLFSFYQAAIDRTQDVAKQCTFSLDDLRYEYPDEPIPSGTTPMNHLAALIWKGAEQRYSDGVPTHTREALIRELDIIAAMDYAPYFLTVYNIVRYARSKGIFCQGRGSAANSAVCFCLGITAIDPAQSELLFARFISTERLEPPDIDVDFEHERREEIIQYIYQRYGRERAGIAATVIHYRPKRAIREVGKVFGLSEDTTSILANHVWRSSDDLWSDETLIALGLDPLDIRLKRTIDLAQEIIGFPRHLSQHVGGFVLTRGRLDETVPIANAAMEERTFIEWDKDDINALGMMKVDILALGMLSCIRKALNLLDITDMADIPQEDDHIYEMLQKGDTIGVFQVESRAQMNMLPRLQPKTFYDLVIQVAIVRPGPIQGDMVHPYLRRRQNLEIANLPAPSPEYGNSDELERVLGRTLEAILESRRNVWR